MSQVIPFLESQTYFITGITGFLGKVLLIKLISTCQNLKENSICVLVRGKGELSATDRFDKEYQDSYILRFLPGKSWGEVRKFIKVIDGDVSKSKLGMTPTDYDYVANNATCIIHMAATTTFTENLRIAFEINTIGTKRMLSLAKCCKHLVSMVYVSTCYANSTRHSGTEIREKVYPINFDPYEIVKEVSSMTPEEAEKATPHIIGSHPNTYTFSKMLTEHIALEEKENIPLAIVRPSIIGASYRFPVEGWVDSYIGASGLIAASSLGVLHGMHAVGSCIVDFIPVDFVVDTILVTAWHTKENPPGERMPIYHSATSSKNPYYWDHLRTCVIGYYRRKPPKRNIGPIWCIYLKNPLLFYLHHTFFTRLPATFADTKRLLKGETPKMVAGSKVLYKACHSLSFFTLHSWIFASHNTQALYESLNETDGKIFNFDNLQLNWELWVPLFCEGIKRFIFHEEPELEPVKRRSKL